MSGHPLCLDFLTVVEASPPQLVELAARTGCASVSFMVHAVAGVPDFGMAADGPMRRETLARCRDTGIAVDMVEGFLLTPEADLDAYGPSFASAAVLGAGSVNVLLRDPEPARLADRFGAFCSAAAAHGLGTLVEWSIRSPHPSPAAAAGFLASVGQGRLQVDVLHLYRGGFSAADVAALDPALVGRGQLCDGPAFLPADRHLAEAFGDRLVPGDGALPLADFVAALPPGVTVGLEVPGPARGPEATARAERGIASARALIGN